jgi:hypothetical protein
MYVSLYRRGSTYIDKQHVDTDDPSCLHRTLILIGIGSGFTTDLDRGCDEITSSLKT